MRYALIIALLALACASPAAAKSDKPAPGQAPAVANSTQAVSSAGKKDKPADPNKGGSSASQPGNGKSTAKGKSGESGGAAAAPQPAPVDQDEALHAVESREALPLTRIMTIAEAQGGVHVINARLVRIQGVLLYQLTMLADSGRSWRAYYFARSGNPVDLN